LDSVLKHLLARGIYSPRTLEGRLLCYGLTASSLRMAAASIAVILRHGPILYRLRLHIELVTFRDVEP
jgi:hypothetical protein